MRPRAILLAALLPACAGCRPLGFYLDNPVNPMEGIRKIAVIPVGTPGTDDPVELGDMLAAELVQFPGVEVVRPSDVQSVARKNSLGFADEGSIRAIGRLSGADAVLAVELTEYVPYSPPRIGFAAQLFFTAPGSSDARTAIDLSAMGRARPVARLDRGGLIQIEKVYDGSQREVRHMAATYARGHATEGEAIDGADRVLRLPDFYFRFVSNRLVRDIFAAYRERRSASRDDGSA
jgi:hypothetical protein